MQKDKIKNVIKLAVSILIIFFIISFIGTEKILNAASEVKTEYFVIAIFFFVISTILTTFAILDLVKNKLYKTFKFKAISWSAGLFLPSKIGESSFVFLLKKEGLSGKKALAIFLVDRLVSFSIISVLSIIAILKYTETNIDLSHITIFIFILILLLIKKNKIKEFKPLDKIFFITQEAEEYLKKEKSAIGINYFFSIINFILMFLVIQLLLEKT